MVLAGYSGPPPSQLSKEFVNGWKALRDRFEEALQMPSLPEEYESKFFQLKMNLVARSRVIEEITEGQWGLHNKVKGFINSIQSLDFLRQESSIYQDNIRNQWHDAFIQANKMVAVFENQEKDQEDKT